MKWPWGWGAVWEALAWAGPAPGEPQAWGLRRVASLEQPAHAQPSPARSLTCAQDRPAAPFAAGPAVGLGELVGRHLVEDASDTTVAFVPPPRGAGLGFPTRCSSILNSYLVETFSYQNIKSFLTL